MASSRGSERCGVEPCAGGPARSIWRLCASDALNVPSDANSRCRLGAAPFHFLATSHVQGFGPFAVPAGVVIDGFSFDYTESNLGCLSAVARITVQ